MVFPNTITTPTAICNAIVAKIISSVEDIRPENAFLCAAATWLGVSYVGDRYVEVVPGAAVDLSAEQGVGRRRQSITVATFWRLMVDQDGQDTVRLADSTLGLLQFVDGIDAALINSALGGLANVPMLPDRMEQAERDPEEIVGDWVMVKRIFKVVYLYSFPDTQDLS